MYQRSERAKWLSRINGSRYVPELETRINGSYVSMKDLQKIAEVFPDDFLYKDKALYSPDMKVTYGYAVDGDSVWKIPESVEIFDNIFDPAEGYMDPNNLKEVYIGRNFREIVEVHGCFGMSL